MVDTKDLKSFAERRAGSTPASGTRKLSTSFVDNFCSINKNVIRFTKTMNKKRKNFNIFAVFVLVCSLAVSVYYYVPTIFGDTVYPLKYANWITQYSKECNVDPSLVAAVIMQESRFNPDARSGAGAQGLMQFMPGTANTMAKELGIKNYNIFDPETSIHFGACHLRDLITKYNGNTDAALAAYNAGTGNVDNWLSLGILNKIPFRETNNYVKKVNNYQNVYKSMYATELGLEPIKLEQSSSDSKVRSFVWGQIFSNFLGAISTNK